MKDTQGVLRESKPSGNRREVRNTWISFMAKAENAFRNLKRHVDKKDFSTQHGELNDGN